MGEKITALHRIVLWVSTISCFIFGISYYAMPGLSTTLLNVNAPDLIAIATIGGFLLAAFIGSVFSLKSGIWTEVRIVTYSLMTWSLLNGLRMLYFTIADKDLSLMPNTILCLFIGIGLCTAILQRRYLSKKIG